MTGRAPPKLLVSVRSAEEAQAALAGGADLIDVKEPANGPLGAAHSSVIRRVVAVVGKRVPVSAALGEWWEWDGRHVPPGLAYAKWGLARWARVRPGALQEIRLMDCATYPVLVGYADHVRVGGPDLDWLVSAAGVYKFPAFLLDTAVKDGTSLLDWVKPAALAALRFRLADIGVRLALAGSLTEASIRRLAPLEPDWFAVRGAACEGGRLGRVSAHRVRDLRAIVAQTNPATAS